MSKSYAWRPLALLPILKGSVCTEMDEDWLRHRRLELYHRSMELQKKDPQVSEYQNGQVLAGGDARRKTLANLWYARVYRKRTVWKGRLVDPVGQALQGSNSRRGSRILEGPG